MWIEQAVVELIDTGSSGWEVETWEERLEWWGGEGGGGVVKVVVVGLDPAFSQLRQSNWIVARGLRWEDNVDREQWVGQSGWGRVEG